MKKITEQQLDEMMKLILAGEKTPQNAMYATLILILKRLDDIEEKL